MSNKPPTRLSRVFLACFIFIATVVVLDTSVTSVSAASTIYSNSSTGSDSTGDGSLANPYRSFHKAYTTAASGDTISLNGTFTWTDAEETGDAAGTGYTLNKDLTIVGQSNASTIVQAASSRGTADRMVFFVAAGRTITFRDMTIRYGRVTVTRQGAGITLAGEYCGGYPCSSITGTAILERVIVTMNDAAAATNVSNRAGGIYMREASTLTLTDSAVTSNTCTCQLYAAAGIAGGEQSQKLTVVRSTIADNSTTSSSGATYPYSYASAAGGIALQRFGQFVMTNSTMYGNSTNNYAGALSLYYPTRPILTNVTIVNNSASLGAGGILWKTEWSGDAYKLYMRNVLVANNTGVSGAGSDFYSGTDSYSTTHVVPTNSILENVQNITLTGTGVVTGEQSSLDLASGLADNGSSRGVQTLAIGSASIAVDAGSAAAHGPTGNTVTPPTSDQRGFDRAGTSPDIGAFEYGSPGDLTAPSITSATPADNSTGVALSTNLSLSFDDPVTAVAGKNIVIKKSSDNSTIETIDATDPKVTVQGSTVTVDPATTLADSTAYYVNIDVGAFQDGSSNGIAGIQNSTAWNFTTVDLTAPTLSSSTPADNATGIGLNANIVLSFSEAATAVVGKNIVIKKSSDDSVFESIPATDARVTGSGTTTITVNPTGTFGYLTSYYVTIESGAFRDASSNLYAGISSTTALDFTTIPDTTPPTLSSSSPVNSATGVSVSANVVLTFSETVVAVAGKNIVIKKYSDNSTVETIAANALNVTVSGATVTVDPIADLPDATMVYVNIDAGAFTDTAGNNYAGIATTTTLRFTTVDLTPPVLSASTPADNATGVGLNANIVLTFSEAATAIAGKNIVIKKTSDDSVFESIPATDARVTGSGTTTVTVNPTGTFAYLTSYYVTIESGAFRDSSSNLYTGISSSTALNFTTLADTVAPTLSSWIPTTNATGVSVTANVVLTFSETVVAVAGKNVVIKRASDNAVLETIPATDARVTISGSTVTVNPNQSFSYSTAYYVNIDAGAFADTAANAYAGLANTTSVKFTAEADTTPPTLASSTPSDNAVGVSLGADLVLTFSETVVAVAGKNIVIKRSSDNAVLETIPATDARVTVSGSTVTVNPNANLADSTAYYVNIDAGAFKDAANNSYVGISDSTTLNFNTVDLTAPTLASSNPSNGATGVPVSANIVLNFSEPIVAVAGQSVVIRRLSDNAIFESIDVGSANVVISGVTATINPAGTFANFENYYVTITSGAFTDGSGNAYGGISTSSVLGFSAEVDALAPTLSSAAPADDAIGVARNSNIVFTFTEPVVAVTGKFVVIKKSSDNSVFESIPATDARVTVSGSTVIVNPTSTFDYLVGYYVLVDVGAFEDLSGNVFGGQSGSTTQNFTTEADTIAPTVVSLSPADDATGVALTANMSVTFSETVVAVAGKTVTIVKSADSSTFESIPVTDARVSISGSTLTLNPNGSFQNGVAYHVLIDSGAFADGSGNPFAGFSGTTIWNFTAVPDTTPPSLLATTPVDDATGVSTTADLVFTFSENVTAAAGKNVVIKKISDNTTVESIPATDPRVTVSGTTVTINPSANLAYSTGYYVIVDSGAFLDTAGNPFAGVALPTTLNFTTDAAPGAATIYSNSSTGDDAVGNGTAGSPYRTFHKAYAMASAGDTINLTGTFTWTDSGEAGDLAGSGYTLAKNLTIVGQSSATTVVQAAPTRGTADRMVFFVAANTAVTIKNLAIRYGRVTAEYQGGGITLAGQYCGSYPCASITGTATLQEVIVTMNDAPSSANVMHRAGGIYMREASTLTLTDSAVSSNTCSCYLYAAAGIAGGEQSQKLTITGSTIANNTATSTAGATYPYSYASVAGGIALQRFGQLVMTNSTLYGNTTNNYGGALSLYYQTRPILTNVTIARNSASLGAGGILWQTAWSGDYLKLFMKNVLLADNSGVAGAGSDFYSASDSYSTSHVVAANSIIENVQNIAMSGTGVVTGEQASLDLASGLADNGATWGPQTLAIGDSSIAINAGSASAHGSAGYTVTPPNVDQRRASRASTIDIGAFENGGGVTPTTTTTSTTTTTLPASTTTTAPATTSTTSSTSSTTSTSTSTTVAPQSGSGRLIWYVDSVSGSDSRGNGSASLPYATFTKAYTAARAGDIIDLSGTFTWTDSDETGDVVSSGFRIAKNLTIRGEGAGKTFVQAASRAGSADRAVFTVGATVTLRDLTIRHGRVTASQQGGGVTNNGQLILSAVTVENNSAVSATRSTYYNAGGVFSSNNTTLEVDKSTIRENTCACTLYGAGGIWTLQSVAKTITNSTINNNRGTSSWGSTYSYNYASVAGGFGTFRFGTTIITNSTFFGNVTDNYGGAMVIYYQDYANLTNLTVASNEAVLGAGGILYQSEWDGYNLNLKNSLLVNNKGVGFNDFFAANAASAARMNESFNVVEYSSGRTFSGQGDIVGARDDLAIGTALAPNASKFGPDTLVIGRDSVAKDAGSSTPNGSRAPVTPPSTDQRGLPRVGNVDIGAFENQSDVASAPAAATATTTSPSTTSTSTTSTTVASASTTAVARSTSTSSAVETTSTLRTKNAALPTTAVSRELSIATSTTEVTIDERIVATTAPDVPPIDTDAIEDLPVKPENETEVIATNGSVEILLSIVDKSFSELLQGRTGALIAKQGLYAKVRAKGFMAGTLAEVWIFSTPRLAAHLQVSAKGDAAGYVLIPNDIEIGEHHIELRGRAKDRKVVKANIALKVLADEVAPTTIAPNVDDVATAVTLPTEIPALIVEAPQGNTLTLDEGHVKSVIQNVLGDVDIRKIKLRIRINAGPWIPIDTSRGGIASISLGADSGTNNIEFEITPEGGQPIVVQRQVLVAGSPEAKAYIASSSGADGDSPSTISWLLGALFLAAVTGLIGVLLSRRRKKDPAMVR